MSGFHGAFATAVASQQGTLTLPDTWFRPPFWDLLMLQLLRPNSSNLPCLCSTFHLEYPLVLSRFYFSHWSKTGSVVQRVAWTVAEVFRPVGDRRGARYVWEAFCAVNGVKSLIGNYRDNRFNALFQTVAEGIVHRQDFITVMESFNLSKSPNLLLKSFLADLRLALSIVWKPWEN